jgi:hypothetical protein
VLELEKNEQSSLAAGGGKTQLKNPQADTTSALAVESKFPSESSPAAETEISGDLNPAMKMNQGLGALGCSPTTQRTTRAGISGGIESLEQRLRSRRPRRPNIL